ncbi:unnamed protein product [Thelazia callipaeda]|uniref:AMP-binding domain-containing protein n=1 Tax=Thelazia callipaeda TaxID=103827 RepID=A0A0N5CWP8_THECL|nr:unnamed protein product [Thelazia callipaeda]
MEVQCPFQIPLQITKFDDFAEYFFDKFAKYGNRLAMVDVESGKQWSYTELRACTENCAKRLTEIGVSRGTRCALVCSVSAKIIFIHFACSMLDAVVISVSASLSSGEIWGQLNKSKATYCFAEQHNMARLEKVRRIIGNRSGGRILSIRLLEEIFEDMKSSSKFLKTRENLVPSEPSQIASKLMNKEPQHAVSCIDLVVSEQIKKDETTDSQLSSHKRIIIFYSITSSELPKPVEVLHRSLLQNLQQMNCSIFGPPCVDDRCLLAANIHHVFGLVSALLALRNGAQLFVTAKQQPRQILNAIKDCKVTIAYVIPTFVYYCSKDFNLEKSNLKPLRSVITSGAQIGEHTMKLCKKHLNLDDLRQAYSVSEAGIICSLALYGQNQLKSVGVPLPGLRFKILSWELKQICAPRELGQIFIEGPPVRTRMHENLKCDAGYYDENGYIFVVNKVRDVLRFKDKMIVFQAYNFQLWPSEMENILHEHAGIDDCAIIGRLEHPTRIRTPTTFIVKNSLYQQLAPNEIRNYLASRMPYFKEVAGGIYFVPEIPRSACGKILRSQLKQMRNYVHLTYRNYTNNPNIINHKLLAAIDQTKASESTCNELTEFTNESEFAESKDEVLNTQKVVSIPRTTTGSVISDKKNVQ